uniref:Uncharacterized protein n=1 Tax=Acrobeloides nanus TaxID=290746 RepID=A0A914CDK4_9BILA
MGRSDFGREFVPDTLDRVHGATSLLRVMWLAGRAPIHDQFLRFDGGPG